MPWRSLVLPLHHYLQRRMPRANPSAHGQWSPKFQTRLLHVPTLPPVNPSTILLRIFMVPSSLACYDLTALVVPLSSLRKEPCLFSSRNKDVASLHIWASYTMSFTLLR